MNQKLYTLLFHNNITNCDVELVNILHCNAELMKQVEAADGL